MYVVLENSSNLNKGGAGCNEWGGWKTLENLIAGLFDTLKSNAKKLKCFKLKYIGLLLLFKNNTFFESNALLYTLILSRNKMKSYGENKTKGTKD